MLQLSAGAVARWMGCTASRPKNCFACCMGWDNATAAAVCLCPKRRDACCRRAVRRQDCHERLSRRSVFKPSNSRVPCLWLTPEAAWTVESIARTQASASIVAATMATSRVVPNCASRPENRMRTTGEQPWKLDVERRQPRVLRCLLFHAYLVSSSPQSKDESLKGVKDFPSSLRVRAS